MGIDVALSALVAWAEVAGRIILREKRLRRLLLLAPMISRVFISPLAFGGGRIPPNCDALPWSFVSMGRD